jgi:RNA polymerase-binding transcription factor DksA
MSKAHAETKATLERKLRELEERAQGLENRLSHPGEADSEENAILRENDEVLEGLNELTIHDIHEIRLALDRIAHGTYGKCISCGQEIAKARLQALPFVGTCMQCAP